MTNTIRIRLLALLVTLALTAVWMNQSRADAPVGHYVINNGTVLDTKSQLIWEQDPSPDAFTWNDAQTHCKTLALDSSVWRAPSMKELQTLVDETTSGPAIDTTAFPNALLNQYWTSSKRMDGASNAWLVRFDIGDTNFDDVSYVHRVRCVR
jgi:hypothetical protein